MTDTHDYCVYIHRLKDDGRVYIGQTCNLANRWCGKGTRYEKCPRFGNAIKKYGWDNFTHEILLDSLSKEEADVYEDYLIEQYRANQKGFGFNIRGGGSRGKQSAESIEKARQCNLGRKLTEETRRKMSNSRRGVPLSEYHKRRISESRTNNSNVKKANAIKAEQCKKLVLCVDTGVIYPSVNDAAMSVGVSKTCISECLHGKQRTSKGFHWRLVR